MNSIQRQNNGSKFRKYKKNFTLFVLIAALVLNYPIILRAESSNDLEMESLEELRNTSIDESSDSLESDSDSEEETVEGLENNSGTAPSKNADNNPEKRL